jgi:choline dehydrogenase-like flavoprotein
LESGHTSFDEEIHRLNEIDDATGRYTRALDGRFRGLGGSSSRWGGRMIPISASERGDRPHIAQPAWPLHAAALDGYEAELQELFQIDGGAFDGAGLDAVDRQSFFPRDDEDIATRWAKCPRYRLCNVATALGRKLEELKTLDIWLGATVCGFDLDRASGRLKSITARNLNDNMLTVHADEFVIAAGTIESTRLLLLIDALNDGRPFAGCDALGRYFQDHLKARVATIDRRDTNLTNRLFAYRFVNATRRDLHLELSETAQRDDRTASAFAYIAMDLKNSPLADLRKLLRSLQRRDITMRDIWRLQADSGLLARAAFWRYAKGQMFVPADVDLDLMVCVEQLPKAENRIRLSSQRDRFGIQKVLLEWAPTSDDERTFRSMIRHLGLYWRKTGFERLCPLRLTPAARDPASPVIAHAQACAHPSGSTRMGLTPSTSVVGPDLRCHAIPNVAIASASVFPMAGSANPTFTIMKMALWLADSYLAPAAVPVVQAAAAE